MCVLPQHGFTAARSHFYLDGGFCLPYDPMKAHQTRWNKSFTFAEGSFVAIPAVRLTLHDQKSGCLMFYQRQLGGCLCMCLLDGVRVSVSVCVCSNHSMFGGVLVRLQFVSVQKEDR